MSGNAAAVPEIETEKGAEEEEYMITARREDCPERFRLGGGPGKG